MKATSPIIHGGLALIIVIAAILHVQSQRSEAGKPQPPGGGSTSMEVLVTGAVYSVADHTAGENPQNPSGYHDVCREHSFSGEGDKALTLRKTTLFLPFPASPGGCGYDGPGLYRRAPRLLFASNPAGPGSTVLLQVFVAHNYLLEGLGAIESGQWPPTATTPHLRIRIRGDHPAWKFITYGGVAKSCRRGPMSAGGDVVIDCTRNDTRTNDVCDCPFDYDDTDADRVADECDCCPDRANFDQADSDGDGFGDVCDPVFDDADSDGVGDGYDNCPGTFNPDQADADMDGIGDACESH
jgi:hypothetical protein